MRVNYNPITATYRILKELKADDRSWVGCIGVSWFWLIGAITLTLVPVIVKSHIGGGVEVATAINLFFAIGIAAGSLSAAALAHGRIELAPAPFMLIIIGLIGIHLGVNLGALPTRNDGSQPDVFFRVLDRHRARHRDRRLLVRGRSVRGSRSSRPCRPGRARTGARA